ncbi:AGAP005927-PA-like protein [Anopheles sinensis]|uniref:Ribosomal protein n=1 Tax=Anopheles sinensis TaxID=74873 RepID=A0A084W2K0_ANOSI|nr:AGAP005927-PA-like protein [Anopheles sinensis]
MWNLVARIRSVCSVTLSKPVEMLSLVRPTACSSFHSLSQPRQPAPLANQCSTPAIAAPKFLQPIAIPLLQHACGFKVKGRLKRRCKDCYFVMRQERLYVICKTHPRHKQMSMKKHDRNTWILTDATQSKIRAW